MAENAYCQAQSNKMTHSIFPRLTHNRSIPLHFYLEPWGDACKIP